MPPDPLEFFWRCAAAGGLFVGGIFLGLWLYDLRQRMNRNHFQHGHKNYDRKDDE